jgi:hypothetical protein
MSDSEELRHWLANEDWYPSRHTQAWLSRTDPDVAADILASLAERADLESRNPAVQFIATFAAGFSPSGTIGGEGAIDRKAGIRAALMLAEMGDVRSVPPLVRIFEPYETRQSKYQAQIEKLLGGIFTQAAQNSTSEIVAVCADPARTLAERIWNERTNRDLTPVLADLLYSVARFLLATGNEQNRTVVQRIAENNATKPQRRNAQDQIRLLLQKP